VLQGPPGGCSLDPGLRVGARPGPETAGQVGRLGIGERTVSWLRSGVIDLNPLSIEGDLRSPETPESPTVPAGWSRLSLAAAIFAVPSFLLVLLLPGWLFQRLVSFEMEGVGPIFLTLFIAVWAGFVGGILGGLGVRRLRGPEPGRRGRAWAFLASSGTRALLMVVAGALGSVVLGRGGDDAPDPEFLLSRWIAGFSATLLVAGLYLRARLRALGTARTGRGWWVFAGGMLLHLGLIAALPVSLFQAFATFRPEVVRGGGQNRRFEGPKVPGWYAQRSVKLIPPAGSPRVTLSLRWWQAGEPRELGRREVIGPEPIPLDWHLVEGPEADAKLSLRWMGTGKTPEATWPLELPTGVDLTPVPGPTRLRLDGVQKTNLWLFQDFDQAHAPAPGARPARAVELVIESAPSS